MSAPVVHHPLMVWSKAFFEATDSMEASRFAEFFHSEASFTFANAPKAVGRPAIANLAQGVFALLDSLRHEIVYCWGAGEVLVVEGRVFYERKPDLAQFEFPFCSVFEFADPQKNLVKDYRAYIDAHELFQ